MGKYSVGDRQMNRWSWNTGGMTLVW